MNPLFFELVRVAIGTQETLSRYPSEDEWMEVFDLAVKQSLVGVCFVGLQRLGADADDGFEKIGMSEGLYLNWMGMAAQINMKNDVVNEQCVELQKRLEADGLRSSILKGQAVAMLYGEELRGFRQSGDIDIYVDCGRERAIEYARSIQGDVNWDYKHLHLKVFDASTSSATAAGTEVEMHYVPEVFLNLRKNRKLQKWFKEPEVQSSLFQVCPSTGSGTNFTTPSVEFNLFYILLHTYRHFLYEGVGMRQLMDYFFVLRSEDVDESMRQRAFKTISSFEMTRFASGIMWIMNEVLGMPEQFLLCEPDEKEGRYILDEVMASGNFGHHDKRLADDKMHGKVLAIKKILKHNLHLLTHYPGDTLWAPIWIVYHWFWKRMHRI